MKKENRFFILACALMALGLSACASFERSTASSLDEGDHFRPFISDRM